MVSMQIKNMFSKSGIKIFWVSRMKTRGDTHWRLAFPDYNIN